MSPEKIAVVGFVVLLILIGAALIFFRAPRKVRPKKYLLRWRNIQVSLKDNKLWPMAVMDADALLSEVLKKRKISGKTMGERMVAAQKLFSDHDSVWQAHKLRNKIAHGEIKNLKELEVKKALIAFRQALRDLGAL